MRRGEENRQPAPPVSRRPHLCLRTMWDLAMEMLGKGDPVPYERCVRGLNGQAAATVAAGRQARPGCGVAGPRRLFRATGGLLGAVDAWRETGRSPWPSVRLSARPSSPTSTISAPRTCCPTCPRNSPCPAGEHRIPADQGRLVLRLDELSWPRPQRGRQPEVRSDLRNQRFARKSRFPEFHSW